MKLSEFARMRATSLAGSLCPKCKKGRLEFVPDALTVVQGRNIHMPVNYCRACGTELVTESEYRRVTRQKVKA